MTPRRRPLRMRLGLALGVAMGVTLGCMQDEDFVAEYAVEVCRMVRDCGRELTLPGETEPLPSTSDCEAIVESHYSACGERCNFRRSKARRCLRRLRDNVCEPDDIPHPNDDYSDETIPLVCSAVYDECDAGGGETSQCVAPAGCSAGGRAGEPALPLLGLLLLGARRRRR